MARAKNIESLERQIEQLKLKEKQLKAQKQTLINREKAKERKMRNHALIVLGGFVENACGGNWKAINYRKLDKMLQKYAGNYHKTATYQDRSAKEATEALREYESEKRKKAKAAKADTKRLMKDTVEALSDLDNQEDKEIPIKQFFQVDPNTDSEEDDDEDYYDQYYDDYEKEEDQQPYGRF